MGAAPDLCRIRDGGHGPPYERVSSARFAPLRENIFFFFVGFVRFVVKPV